jgi:ribosomal protein S18 acetylase RimI-like enzyme
MGVRRAGPRDMDNILRLVAQLGYEVENERGRAACEMVLADPDNAVFVFEEDGSIVGMLSLNVRPQMHHAGLAATIDELVVDEAARGRGIGAALVREAVAFCRERGCAVIDVASAHHRIEAKRFYLANGFRDYGVKLVYEVAAAHHHE